MNFKFITSLTLVLLVGGLINMAMFRFINTFNLNVWLNLFLSGGFTFFISGLIANMNGGDTKKNDN